MRRLFQSLLLLIAKATDKQLAKHVQYLKAENEILRQRLPERIIVTPKERHRLLKLASRSAGDCRRSNQLGALAGLFATVVNRGKRRYDRFIVASRGGAR